MQDTFDLTGDRRLPASTRAALSSRAPGGVFVAAASCLAILSCGPRTQLAPDEAPPLTEAATAPSVAVPSSPAGRALIWAIDAVDPARDLPATDELASRLSPAFVASIPVDSVRSVLQALRAQTGGLALESLEHVADSQIVAITRDASGAPWRVLVSASAAQPFVIDGLLYRPAPELDMDLPSDWPSLLTAVRALAPQTALLAARVDDAGCTPIASHMPELQLPIGSGFKLLVLGALLDAIEAGSLDWDSQLPTSERTVLEAAEAMISVSDNPAADELIALLGRERIEQGLTDWGLTEPERSIPFLTTLELFVLKGTRDGELGQRYLSADLEGRRELLRGITPTDIGALRMWGAPRMLDIEWFASASDMCRVMARMHERADADGAAAAARHVLSLNPGIAIRSEDWLYAAYKGGSEPGLIHMSWLLEDASRGRWFFSLTAVSPEAPINDGVAVALAAVGVDLLAGETRPAEAP